MGTATKDPLPGTSQTNETDPGTLPTAGETTCKVTTQEGDVTNTLMDYMLPEEGKGDNI